MTFSPTATSAGVGLPPADIVSGEGVRLVLPSAGVGSRTIAALVDLAIMLFALLLLELLDVAVAGGSDGAAVAALAVTETVLVFAGYPVVMEWLTRGRTVGKIWLGLRVVRDDGGPIGFRQALVRGLAGLVLEKPGLLFPITTLIGVVTISTSSREKRVGDMMAGTIVLNERAAPPPAPPQTWVPPELVGWAQSLDLTRMSDTLGERVRLFVARAPALTPTAQHDLGERLRHEVLAVISPPPPTLVPTPTLLISVLAERRRRAQPAGYAQSGRQGSDPQRSAPPSGPAPSGRAPSGPAPSGPSRDFPAYPTWSPPSPPSPPPLPPGPPPDGPFIAPR